MAISAAGVHHPVGGQGLNLGVQDAVNLGWKLAQVLKGVSAETLLDTHRAERHPVAEFLGMDEPRGRLAAEMSGLGVRYDLGEGHPLLGRRMPDLDLVTADGARRAFSLSGSARPTSRDATHAGSHHASHRRSIR